MPTTENMPPFDKITLNANNTHGKYMALNLVPNQKLTIVSLFSWHQTYSTDRIIGSIRSYYKHKVNEKVKKKKNKKYVGTYLKVSNASGNDATQPIEDQQETVIAGRPFEMIRFQT